ncbi:DotU family type IV/VI secretion system protein [Leekyejoonella antrihumi]|uniref:DotU family type IV/VI secretion system protein n=1 Tax=Leekyejoonella antrihumi TaxID=1660198 RepID=A0A563E6R2_9MICO|nr:DotU family type IV/VI secretion system protein [Leekyejoonella antrihumi]TWP38248.1 DotU family type IV/VI secretion system protein [Leekyejoonella antrihumi]
MNAPDDGGSGPKGPDFDDTFDHFFSKRPQRDPDETRPVPTGPPPGGPDEATHEWRGTTPPPAPVSPRQAPIGQQFAPGWTGGQTPEQPRRRGGAALPLLVIAASLIVVAVVVYFALGNGSKAPVQANHSPLPTASGSASPRSGGSSGSSAPSSSSPSSPSNSAAPLPQGSSDCHSTAYAVGPKTSCEFGASVAAAAGAAAFKNGTATLTGVYSPETKQNYTLTCTQGGYLTCVTTTGAVVYVEKP